MAATDQSKRLRPARGRRTPRASGDDRERAILRSAEELLQQRALSEISVDDLARGAGISRPTFYFYFASKDAVVLTLVDRMVEEATIDADEVLLELPTDPRGRWRQGLEDFYEIFRARRAVILAGAELRASNAEARALWAQIMEGWVADVSSIIEAERERGAAPAGLPASELAVALLQMNERVQHATFARESPAVAEEDVVDVLLEIWLRAIYGAAAPQ
jgi:AcrR family transcriptional regulator